MMLYTIYLVTLRFIHKNIEYIVKIRNIFLNIYVIYNIIVYILYKKSMKIHNHAKIKIRKTFDRRRCKMNLMGWKNLQKDIKYNIYKRNKN